MKEDVDLALKYHMQARESAEAREGIAAFNEKAETEVVELTRRSRATAGESEWLLSLHPAFQYNGQRLVRGRRVDDGSKPTVGTSYINTGATKSFCLKLDEFHLLLVNLPCAHRWKDCNTIFILKHTNRRARDIVAI